MDFLKRHTIFLQCLAITVFGALAYANSLTGVFQFDDKLNIVDNHLIKHLGNFWPPSGNRWFGTLTFALNYRAGGLNPHGYHLVNVGIHLLTALSIYSFVLLTLRTPFFSNSNRKPPGNGIWLSFACSLLFAVHPIQTQAVSYIVQRYASLATLLFLLSLICYVLARIAAVADCSARRHAPYRIFLYSVAFIFGLLAVSTKENAVTLPVVVVIYDLMFISGGSGLADRLLRRWRTIAAFASVTTVLAVIGLYRYDLMAILNKLKATNEISRHDYLVTQFRVIVTYLRLLLVPVGQSVDHNYPVYRSIADPAVAASLGVLLLLVATAVLLCRKSRTGDPRLRLISFGILWFFVTLSIESGLIPISDVMFEHRLYLPSIGAILALTVACDCLLDTVPWPDRLRKRAAMAILAAIAVVFCAATLQRNRVWQNELSLWNDVIDKTPRNPRGYNMVGNYYRVGFRLYDAVTYYRKALEVDPGYTGARSNLGSTYIQLGMIDEGLRELFVIARQKHTMDEIDTGILYYNIAHGFKMKGMPDLALENLNKALLLIPNEPAVHSLLGNVYRMKGMEEQSRLHFKRAHDLNPQKY